MFSILGLVDGPAACAVLCFLESCFDLAGRGVVEITEPIAVNTPAAELFNKDRYFLAARP